MPTGRQEQRDFGDEGIARDVEVAFVRGLGVRGADSVAASKRSLSDRLARPGPCIAVSNVRGSRARILLSTDTETHEAQSEQPFSSFDHFEDEEDEIIPDLSKFSHSQLEMIEKVRSVAGQPEAVDILREVLSDSDKTDAPPPLLDLVCSAFPFPLDDFQQQAARHLVDGHSVIVTAPTGSGKTLVGEAAVHMALASKRRVFYTTPLKALSNQKFFDFKLQFGESRVGLLTGDTTVNRDAEVVVMTTEVYRNMLYAAESGQEQQVDGLSIGIVDDLFGVIFDEFHFMNDKSRGTVWEESVIISPKHVLLVALSATIANTSEIQDWFTEVHGPTHLVKSDHRPVPLRFGFAARDGLYPLFAKPKGPGRGKLRLHTSISRRIRRSRQNSQARFNRPLPMALRPEFEPPSYNFLVRCLRRQDLLPAIIFIFSRAGCDRAAIDAAKQLEPLVQPKEERQIAQRLDEFLEAHPGIIQEARIALAKQGIASHHAGVLPLWKTFVEELFQDGLLKVIFATETLAAGINMPARTTVLSALAKRSGDRGFERLSTSATLQMAGRAGRRGKDTVGNSIVMQSKEGPFEAFEILTSGVDALQSQFTPTYGMALNLMQKRTVDEIRQLLDKSFGSFQSRRQLSNAVEEEQSTADADKYEVYERARQYLDEYPNRPGLDEFSSLRLQLLSARQALELEIEIQDHEKASQTEDMLLYAPPGTGLLLINPPRRKPRKGQDKAKSELDEFGLPPREFLLPGMHSSADDYESVLLIGRFELPNMFSRAFKDLYVTVTRSNRIRVVAAAHVKAIDFEVGATDAFPEDVLEYMERVGDSQAWMVPAQSAILPEFSTFKKYKGGQYRSAGTSQSEQLVPLVRDVAVEDPGDALKTRQSKVETLERRLRDLPVGKKEDFHLILSAIRTVESLSKDLKTFRDAYKKRKGSTWADFMSVVDMLSKYGFLEKGSANVRVTELGQLGASVRAENELWTSIVLLTDDLGSVSPVSLIGILAAVIAEESNRGGSSFVGVTASEETFKLAEKLHPIGEELRRNQDSYDLECPVNLLVEEAALPEFWASGASWTDMLGATSLQEGDICRKLRRLMDLLRQIPRLPGVPESVKKNAKRGLMLMDRFPVADDVTYSVEKDETEDVEVDADGVSLSDAFEGELEMTQWEYDVDSEDGDDEDDEDDEDEDADNDQDYDSEPDEDVVTVS